MKHFIFTHGSRRNQAGFSLSEVVVASLVSSVMFAGLYSFYRSQVFAYRTQQVAVNLKEEADLGIDLIVKELRIAGARPASYPVSGCTVPRGGLANCAGFQRVTAASAQGITFQYDYLPAADPDGCPDDLAEQITYSYDTSNPNNRLIKRTAIGVNGGQSVTVVSHASDFQLIYYDVDGSVMAAPTNEQGRKNVGRIEVRITTSDANPDPSVGGQLQRTRVSSAYLRNLHC